VFQIEADVNSEFVYNRDGYFAFNGEVGHDIVLGIPSSDRGLWTGSMDEGASLALETGSQLPDIPGSTRFGVGRDFSLARDGSVGAILGTQGAQNIDVLASIVDNDVKTLLKEGDDVSDGTQPARVREFLSIFRFPESTGAMVSTTSNLAGSSDGRTIMIYPDDPILPAINFVEDINQTVSNVESCEVNLADTRPFVSDFRVFKGDQDSLIFKTAFTGSDCPHLYGVVRYADSEIEMLIGEDESLDSKPEYIYTEFGIDEVLRDGTVVLTGVIRPVAVGGKRVILTIDPDKQIRLLRVFGEVISTPTADYGGSRFDEYDVGENGYLVVKLEFIEGEIALFSDVARSFPASRDITELEGSTLSYLLGTLGPVPEPYGGDHFFTEFSKIHALNDGRVAFIAKVEHPDIAGTVSEGLWISDPANDTVAQELYRFGEALILDTGENVVLSPTSLRLDLGSTEESDLFFAVDRITNSGTGRSYDLVKISTKR